MRFVAVQEPDNSWAVFGVTADEPADYAGCVLSGLTSSEAMRFVAVANEEVAWRESQRSGSHQQLDEPAVADLAGCLPARIPVLTAFG